MTIHRPISMLKLMLAIIVLVLVGSYTTLALADNSVATYHPDEMLKVLGFKVEISGAGTDSDVDSAWETVSGGSLQIVPGTQVKNDDGNRTTTPGYKYIDELTLHGPITVERRSARKNAARYEILKNGAGRFTVEIDGSTVPIHAVSMEDLVIDVREMTTGADWDYRVYGPGDAHFGSITLNSRVGKDSKELYQWWLEASRGKDIRKTISVAVLDRKGNKARTYNFRECIPTTYKTYESDEDGRNVPLNGLTMSCGGGEVLGSGDRAPLLTWITDTVKSSGAACCPKLIIKEVGKKKRAFGATYTYFEAFPTRYVFPSLSASGTGNLYEEIAVKPIRLDLG